MGREGESQGCAVRVCSVTGDHFGWFWFSSPPCARSPVCVFPPPGSSSGAFSLLPSFLLSLVGLGFP